VFDQNQNAQGDDHMYTVSVVTIAWFALAWFVVGVIVGQLTPAAALRNLLQRPRVSKRMASASSKGSTCELYAGNLSYGVSKQDLETAFGEYGGVVDVRIIRNNLTGKSKGYAFVVIADGRSAAAAVSALNGNQLKGRAMVVNEAKSRARD
jgi:hypothetical protein